MAKDRGWNDPPMLTYQPTAMSRHVLSCRPNEMPGCVRNPPEIGPFFSPSSVSGPPHGQAVVQQPLKLTVEKIEQTEDSCIEAGNDVILPHVVGTLEDVFEKTKAQLDKRYADDVRRRLGILKNQWESGKLSKKVREEMNKLVAALQAEDGNTAHLIHVALMVDHVAEVSQWMVGIKRLIVTVQKQQTMKAEDAHIELAKSSLPNGFDSASH